jgi:hypothetical protein
VIAESNGNRCADPPPFPKSQENLSLRSNPEAFSTPRWNIPL